MKLYLLERLFWEDVYTVGVFDSWEKTQWAEKRHHYYGKHRFSIQEINLNEEME